MNIVVLLIKILEWLLIQLAELYVLLEQLSECLGIQSSALLCSQVPRILFYILHYLGTLFNCPKSTSIEDQLLPNQGMIPDIIHVCDVSIVFQFVTNGMTCSDEDRDRSRRHGAEDRG
jgi:hypothetical protein